MWLGDLAGVLQQILQYTDLVLYDLKCIDEAKHKKLTTVSNQQILQNARRVSDLGVPMIARIPVIPGLNDSESDIDELAAFIRSWAQFPRSVSSLIPSLRRGQVRTARARLCSSKSPAAE